MDKRIFLALLLSALVVLATPRLFPTPRPAVTPAADTTATSVRPGGAGTTTPPAGVATVPTVLQPAPGTSTVGASPSLTSGAAAVPLIKAETTAVVAGQSRWTFVDPGAAPAAVTLPNFQSLRPGDAKQPVVLTAGNEPLLQLRLAIGSDTVALDQLQLQRDASAATGATPVLRYSGQVGASRLALAYAFSPDSFLVRIRGALQPAVPGAVLLVDLPSGLRSVEADTLEDIKQLKYSYKPARSDVQSTSFDDLEPGEVMVDSGAFSWVSLRTKYFFTSVMADAPSPAFSRLRMTGAQRSGKLATRAQATALLPLAADGSFGVTFVAAPQQYRLLRGLGGDLVNMNPYGGWLHGMVQPFATIVMQVLLWMKDTTGLHYGWVLIIFGIAIRLLIWPLNQTAMRNSIKMQRLQPEMQALQQKHKNDPRKVQEEMGKIFAAHGMSPLSPMLGCLPMLIPMPVLFALYFVFQNTIEFRGVPFWWMPDLALADPLYIIPLLMGASMFALSWIGSRAAPQTPQTKMMMYIFPVVFTVLFLNFPSGLNLYYFVQNLTTLPQQWLLARERGKSPPPAPPVVTPARPAVRGAPSRR